MYENFCSVRWRPRHDMSTTRMTALPFSCRDTRWCTCRYQDVKSNSSVRLRGPSVNYVTRYIWNSDPSPPARPLGDALYTEARGRRSAEAVYRPPLLKSVTRNIIYGRPLITLLCANTSCSGPCRRPTHAIGRPPLLESAHLRVQGRPREGGAVELDRHRVHVVAQQESRGGEQCHRLLQGAIDSL